MSARAHPLPGPDLRQAYRVDSGLVVIVGEALAVSLPAGATWPGLDHLSPELIESLRPSHAELLPGTRLSETAPDAQAGQAGQALILAQLLRSGRAQQRLGLLRHVLNPDEHTRMTCASICGLTRETVSYVLAHSPERTPHA